jgi:DNA polymerase-3 subunit delta'
MMNDITGALLAGRGGGTDIRSVPIVSLHGHATLRRRLAEAVGRGVLPASLLIHGAPGIGKQRLALWLGQCLLCEGEPTRPCGTCRHCRYATELTHPDLRWFFPRPRLGDADATVRDVLDDYVDAVTERAANGGLYPPPSGTEAIYVATVRAVVQLAALTPTMASRKVFVIGDAERMVPQEGAEAAANAFLKLLEEPPADTTFILTSSEPGALLPTIRSRVVALRAAPLPDDEVRGWLADPIVAPALEKLDLPAGADARVRGAAGAPGALLGGARGEAAVAARELLAALPKGDAEWARAVLRLGGSRARGFFSEVLDALVVELHGSLRDAARRPDAARAAALSRAIDAVEGAKWRAAGNVSPQLIASSLARPLAAAVR